MYDKVKLILDTSCIDGYDWHEVVERMKSNYTLLGNGLTKDNDEGYYWTGRHMGRIDISRRRVLFTGSIPKFMNGHNIYTLSLDEVRQFIERLSDILGLPMKYAVVKELEFAHNFEMRQLPMIYLQKLGGMRKFGLARIGETVYMETTLEKIKFYDKMREARKKRELPNKTELPENLLRYEVTFKNKRLKELFEDGLTAEDLCDKRVFWTLVAEWLAFFENVEKPPQGYWGIDFDDFKELTDFINWCICIANERQNMAYYIKYVLFKNRALKSDNKDRQLHYNIQKKIRQALQWGEEHFPASDSISELINKIEQYLTWLLEESKDGLSVDEEQSLFHS